MRELLDSPESEFLAVYGRRRVGKTFLIERFYAEQMVFSVTGINQPRKRFQLDNFMDALNRLVPEDQRIEETPTSWLLAFRHLRDHLESIVNDNKKVIFIDELPWLATRGSAFLSALENFWNGWASKRNDILLVVCGSAASWMIKNVVRNRGGLHNRITRRMRLMPFDLYETEQFLQKRGVQLERYDVLQLYMVMGGIPHYLKEVRRGQSATQAIDSICFTRDGLLQSEFADLYAGLFSRPELYIEIVRQLAANPSGLTRTELLRRTKLSSGGSTSRIFDALEESGFIHRYYPVGKNSKNGIYKLSDFYSAFYLKFVVKSRATGVGTWIKLSRTSSWRAWSGYAFERLCLAHLPQIERGLGISGIFTEASTWYRKGTNDTARAQIDLVIVRSDRTISLCEMKFSQDEFIIDKTYAISWRRKIAAFREETQTKSSLFLTFITTYGLKQNEYANSMVQQELSMDALFEPMF